MEELTDVIGISTRSIEADYFHLNIDGGDPIYRERVYCYELYHQMRSQWPKGSPYRLNGEIDKAAHPILKKLGASHAKPDLLVHQPGYMTGNHAIIEVKSSRAESNGIKSDLDKLSLFINKVNYRRAIYLVYGDDIDKNLIRKIEKIASQTKNLAAIELWTHSKIGDPATNIQNLK